MNEITDAWNQLRDSISLDQSTSALYLAGYMLLGGLLALYIRMLYRYCGVSPSDSDSITRVFPLLTLVTIGVIAVVKSSLALSLGMVGALSIVRFRAAIKEPEELVYLFLCIGVGLSLGAGQPLLAIMIVATATLFIVGMHFTARNGRQQRVLLTISGDAQPYFTDQDAGVLAVLRELAGDLTVHRMDIENGRGQVRVVVQRGKARDATALVGRLHQRLPECEFSFVDLTATL